ncbi:hypothetical protein [Bradyrhizobium sp.]|uniref:hypothetical protein n=1 Tax=Bradyrhizobium sp. TaxID=376 RepID=UPI001DB05107|nr:hypothetical protein [Bradyrhizobium sp.]MBI5321988.1 hypothetical protein [Bradyrhizobium sp.]
MTYLLALLAGVAGAVLGYLGGAAVGSLLATVFRMSSFEGASGYFVAFVTGPIGAICGLVLGMYLVLRFHGGFSGFSAMAGRMILIVFAIGALAAGGVFIRLATLDPHANRAKPQLLFEMRFASGIPPNRIAAASVELHSGGSTAATWFDDLTPVADGRLARRGGVEIPRRASSRLLVLRISGEPDRIFRLATKPTPEHSDALGPWQKADFIFPEGAERSQPVPANDPFEIRYRVRDPQVEFARAIVEFELELPATASLPEDHEAVAVTARFADNADRGSLRKESWRRIEGDRVVLHGIAQTAGPAGSTIEVAIPSGPVRMFDVTVTPPTPWPWNLLEKDREPRSDAFGPWRSIDRIKEPHAAEVRPARPEDDARVRYFER